MGASSAEYTVGSSLASASREIVRQLSRAAARTCISLRYGIAAALFNAALATVPAPAGAAEPTVILAFGDSLTAGYGLAAADSFPAQLEARLQGRGYNVEVRNAGVSGDTTAGGKARLAWTLAEPADMVILELGANDGLRGIDPAETRRNLEAMLAELERRDIPVLLAGMLAPPNLGPDYGAEFNAIFPSLAERYAVAFYPFFLDGVAAQAALNQADGMHPNAKGVGVIVERILPYVAQVLDEKVLARAPRTN